jgi:glycosyltransferase involved in cell wall biosynthesis
MKKIKVVIVYQVIMHYRLPLYKRLASDPTLNFSLLYGEGESGSKLQNADISETKIRAKKMRTLRIPFKTNNGNGTIPFSYLLFFHLIGKSPDVIISEGTSSILNASIAFLYAKIFRKRFIWWSLGKLQNRKYTSFRQLLVKWEQFIERNSDAIFTYSSQGEQYFRKNGCDPRKIFVGVNVLDTEEKLQEIRQVNVADYPINICGFFNLVFIGSIIEVKNLGILVDVIETLNKKYEDSFRLHLIGDGSYMSQLKSYVTSKGLQEHVVFHGRINAGASRILQECQVMVLPGLGGLAICEAMLNGLPVITGHADGTELDLVNESTGFVINEMTHDNLMSKIEVLFHDPKLRENMSKAAFKRITEDFHFDRYYATLLDAINYSK